MKKLFIILLCLSVLVAFNISSFAYYTATDELRQQDKSYLPDMNLAISTWYSGLVYYSENLSIYPSDMFRDAITEDLFEGGDFYLAEDYVNANMPGAGVDVWQFRFNQTFNLMKAIPPELGDRYDYLFSREYSFDETIESFDLHIDADAVELYEEWDDLCLYVQEHMNITCSGWYILYYVDDDGVQSVSVPIDYTTSDNYIYFGDLTRLEYDFDFCDIHLNFHWQPPIDLDTGYPESDYNRFHIIVPLNIDDNYSWVFRGIDDPDINDIVINVRSINDFNFLEWLANSVQSFFSVTLFRIGSVPVSVGVCMLVPLSLSILIGFLKKFSGG